MTPRARSLPSGTVGPPRVPKPTENAGQKGLFCCCFFGLVKGGRGGCIIFSYLGCSTLFSLFRRADRPSPRPAAAHTGGPTGRPRRCALRPQPPAPGVAATREDRSRARATKTRHRPQTATGETNKQEHIAKAVLPKTNEQSRPSTRRHRAGWRGAGGPPALPCPAEDNFGERIFQPA